MPSDVFDLHQFLSQKYLNVSLITHNGLTTMRAGFVPPGMRCPAACTVPGGLPPDRVGRGLVIGEIDRFDADYPILRQTYVLGMTAEMDTIGGRKRCIPAFEASGRW
jgi:hypothetical protein